MRITHATAFESSLMFMAVVVCRPPNLDFGASWYHLFVGNQVYHYFDNPVILQGLLTPRYTFGGSEVAVAMGTRAGPVKG